jgi:hypothetical protein
MRTTELRSGDRLAVEPVGERLQDLALAPASGEAGRSTTSSTGCSVSPARSRRAPETTSSSWAVLSSVPAAPLSA